MFYGVTKKGGVTISKKKDIPADVVDVISDAEQETCNLAGIKTKRKRPINISDRVKTLAIKCYEEQMIHGWNDVKKRIKSMNRNEYQVIAILHNRDNVSMDAFEKSIEKPHYHIIIRTTNTHSKAMVVKTILKKLGLRYRPDVDKILWENHGVELVGDFNIYTVYLLHETKQAQLDLKALYRINEFVSNLTRKQIEQLIAIGKQAEKPGATTIAELETEAYERGYNLKDWNEWYQGLPEKVRGHKNIKLVHEKYNYGVENRIAKENEILRTCIFIQGESNKGKTYAIRKAVVSLGADKIEEISAGGTGQFDNISPTTDTIILNDNTTSNLLNLCDDYMCRLYRRNSGNPYWCGNFFVATYNEDFDKWVSKCGEQTHEKVYDKDADPSSNDSKYKWIETERLRAIRNRFFVCHIEEIDGVSRLFVDSVPKRGTEKAFQKRLNNFKKFQAEFNRVIATYEPANYDIDLDKLNYTKAELKAMKKDA